MIKYKLLQGTEELNDKYTGPIGTLSMDEDANQVRLHDGATKGGVKLGLDANYQDLYNAINGLGIEGIDGLSALLALKAGVELKAAANGIASLDGESKVPAIQMPSFADDVIDYEDLLSLPDTGEAGKLYVTKDDGFLYRWDGSTYIAVAIQPDTTDDVVEGSINVFFSEQRVRDALSGDGVGILYDSVNGIFDIHESITSVEGQDGAVVLDKNNVELALLLNYATPTENEARQANIDTRMNTPLSTRQFMEGMGFNQDNDGWGADLGTYPSASITGNAVEAAAIVGHSGVPDIIAADANSMYLLYSTGSFLRYNTLTQELEDLAPSPLTVSYSTAQFVGGKMYVLGRGGAHTGNQDVFVYDPSDDSWITINPVGNVAPGRYYASSVSYNGKIYLMGGRDGSAIKDDLWEYDPSNNTWLEWDVTMPLFQHASSEVVGDTLYFMCGMEAMSNYSNIKSRVFAFDLSAGPTNTSVVEKTKNSIDVYRSMSVVVGTNIYIAHGKIGPSNDRTNKLWSYDTVNDSWQELGSFGDETNDGAMVNINGTVYGLPYLANNSISKIS